MAGFEAGLLILHSGGGKVMGSDAILNIGARSAPTFVVGTPGYVMYLAQLAEQKGIRITSLKTAILGAERVSPEYKAKLRDHLARIGSPEVRILSTYGMTEAKKAWIENSEGPEARFLTYPDMEIFEIIDPGTGEPVKAGEPGEIVYTHIGGAGSTVLRYRTGDRVKEGLVWDRCPRTGLILPLLGTTISRVSEIKKVKDTLVDFNELFSWFSGKPQIVDWQLLISKPPDNEFGRDVISLRVVLAEGTDAAAFDEQLQRDFKVQTEIALDNIEHLSLAELAQHLGMETQSKEKRIMDTRPA
jgi:phenylacetate-coenzyme A ligase PaaK-like adenylate-forming protein